MSNKEIRHQWNRARRHQQSVWRKVRTLIERGEPVPRDLAERFVTLSEERVAAAEALAAAGLDYEYYVGFGGGIKCPDANLDHSRTHLMTARRVLETTSASR